MQRRKDDSVGSSATMTPDASKNYAVQSAITANGYTTSMQWDSLLNITSETGPNNATATFGYDLVVRRTSSQGPDGDSQSSEYSVPGRVNISRSGKRFTATYLDGLGRPIKVETGYNPTPSTSVVESVVETEYAPCACTPMGKMKRVSQPRKPSDPAIWTTYDYDELGRVVTVTHPPNTGTAGSSGTTTYLYYANTVKVTDPAGRWKKYTMDGFGNLTSVEESKPGGGSYVSSYVYTPFNQLSTVTMTRDGFSGHTPQSLTQTRTFTYSSDLQLPSTTFPETPGTTTYSTAGDGKPNWKKDYKGQRTYFYDTSRRLIRVERYIGTSTVEDAYGHVDYYYDSVPFTTDFQGVNRQGRLAGTRFNCDAAYLNCMYELYSYTVGGRLKKKRLPTTSGNLELSFEYDAEGKMQYMVYPSGKRVKYTYDDLARHTGLKNVQGATETDIVNNPTYGASGELKSMSWYWSPTQPFATQNWTYNNRLQMTNYTYGGPGGSVNQEYKYSASANDGKLWRKKDHVSGEEVEYQYDTIHRLASAGVLAGTAPGQEWTPGLRHKVKEAIAVRWKSIGGEVVVGPLWT